MPKSEADEQSGWYEQWLREAAGGKRVPTWPLILVWVGLTGIVAGIVYLAGGRAESTFMVPVGVASGLYWFLAVPAYVRKRYRDQ